MPISDYFNKNLKQITPYSPGRPIEDVAREYGIAPEEIVKLASNECPLGVCPSALEAIARSASEMHYYPDGAAISLKEALSKHLNFNVEHLTIGNGSDEILKNICFGFAGPGTSIVASRYAFCNYKIYSLMFGTEVIEAEPDGYSHDLEAMARCIRSDTRVVFICNPNNPTGTMVGEYEIEEFMKKVPDHVLVVFDEAYAEITIGKMPDTLSYVRQGRNAVVLRSFSKAYGMAGLRVGYGITTPEIAKLLEKPRMPFNCNRMGQIAAAAALRDQDFVNKSKETYRKGIAQLSEAFGKMNLRFEKPHTNFIMVNVGNGKDVYEKLMRHGIIVRPVFAYGLPEWIRVSIGTKEQNDKFIEALKQVMRGCG